MSSRILLPFVLPFFLLGCGGDPAPVEFPVVPEPSQPLRPEGRRGAVHEDARIADYVLEARLDTETRQVAGSARVTWRNTTGRAVETLPFHLYMNGFRAEDTEWMRTSRGIHRRNAVAEDGTWGYIDVHGVELVATSSSADVRGPRFVDDAIERLPGEALPLAFREDEDPSTMTVDLPRPVGPGESVTVALDFTTQLPKVVARTGYHDDFYAVGQWYPKIGVLEEDGWQAHTFTVHDEFYADFGRYRAVLDVPQDMVVGAGGIRTGEEIADGRKRLTYEADMVHDFVWMADPDFVEHYGEHDGIRIRQLIHPERVEDVDVFLDAQVAALQSYEKRYGPYPWSTITIVHPPEGGGGAGGMEYPTLYTVGDRAPIPAWVRRSILDERMTGIFVTVHEFGHQYFQGLFASREHLEPWLDEGLNTMSNLLAYEDRFGRDPWMLDFFSQRLHASDTLRATLRFRAFLGPVARRARDFDFLVGDYGMTVYRRTAALMLTLRNLAGPEAFDRALRVYSDRARFRHPTGADLEAVLARELGGRLPLADPRGGTVELDVAAFLDQALHTDRQVDFELLDVRNRRRLGEAGWRRDAGGRLAGGEAPAGLGTPVAELADAEVEGVVAVRRAGAFEVPVELEVEFADGNLERLLWDAREPTAVFDWPGRRVRRATLDPDGDLLLEWDRLDNTAFARGESAGDGLSDPLAALAEALSLALSGMVGP